MSWRRVSYIPKPKRRRRSRRAAINYSRGASPTAWFVPAWMLKPNRRKKT